MIVVNMLSTSFGAADPLEMLSIPVELLVLLLIIIVPLGNYKMHEMRRFHGCLFTYNQFGIASSYGNYYDCV